MESLEIFLFGSPRVEHDGQSLLVGRRNALALLVYLLVTGESQRRETLLNLLWPDHQPAAARAALRRDLSYLKKMVGTGRFAADRTQVNVTLLPGDQVDVGRFQALLTTVREHQHGENGLCSNCVTALTAAAEIYTADFLNGFSLPDSPGFNEWLFFERESLRQALVWVMDALIPHHSRRGEYETAITYARGWLKMDPLHEPAQRQLMELYARSGQQAAALRQYEEGVRLLKEELGVEPEEETTRLFHLIHTRQVGSQPLSHSMTVKDPQGGEVDAVGEAGTPHGRMNDPPSPRQIDHNLPLQETPFIGRETELARLEELLASPGVRLITITGPGGVGKTRLALAGAERQLRVAPDRKPRFIDGVFFVPLASLSQPEHIVRNLAEALDLQLFEGSQRSPRQQLLAYLVQKRLLLVMDNFEHLLEGADLLTDILQAAQSLSILVTSRERLHLGGEQLYPLEGLEGPHVDGKEAIKTAAARLFLAAARRLRPDYKLRDGSGLAQLVRICRQVEGMPLALELAATWTQVLSLEAIADEIQHSLDFLATTLRDVPERHHSMRAVFETSWHRLGETEQDVFARLSVFRGGFSREAAETVAGTSIRELAQLATKSLLTFDQLARRYQIHELLRQFGGEKLAGDGAQEAMVRDRHTTYFCAFIQQRGEELKGTGQKRATAEIRQEFDNCRGAWDWAVSRKHIDHLARALDGLNWFMIFLTFRYREAARMLAQAVELLENSESVERLQLLIRLLAWQSLVSDALGEGAQTKHQTQRALTILDQPPISQIERWPSKPFVLYQLAMGVAFSDRIKAHQLMEESRALARRVGDLWGEAKALIFLAVLEHTLGNLTEAERLSQESLMINRALGNQGETAEDLYILGELAGEQNLLEEAEALIRESVAIYQKLDHHFGIAQSLMHLGLIYIYGGRFAQSLRVNRECRAAFGDRGHPYFIAFLWYFSSQAHLHLGQFEKAHALGEKTLAQARKIEKYYPVAMALRTLGQVALARADLPAAQASFLESVRILRTYGKTGMPNQMGFSLGLASITSLIMGRLEQARQQGIEALTVLRQNSSVWASISPLVAASMLYLEGGQHARGVELFSLARSHPYVANSRWFEAVCGRRLAAAEESLGPAAARAARRRGQTLNWWETLAQLPEACRGL